MDEGLSTSLWMNRFLMQLFGYWLQFFCFFCWAQAPPSRRLPGDSSP